MLLPNPELSESKVRDLVQAGLKVAAVVPCYNVVRHLGPVVAGMPDYVERIYLVNDGSSDGTGELIQELCGGRVEAIHLERNMGVGAAVMAGFERAVEEGAEIVVKMDGDGQMDPLYLPLLIQSLAEGRADYTKGNRFVRRGYLAEMPLIRKIGNAGLSFLARIASGYWNVFDPANGYLAMRREVFLALDRKLVHQRFFFETSLLIALSLLKAVVLDVPMAARYRGETSSLSSWRVAREFPPLLLAGFLRRIWTIKIVLSLTLEAVFGFFGLVLVLYGGIFGALKYYHYVFVAQAPTPAGTVMVAALPIIIGFQLLIAAVVLDIVSAPTRPVCGPWQGPREAGDSKNG